MKISRQIHNILANNRSYALIIVFFILISSGISAYKLTPGKDDEPMIIVNPIGYIPMDLNKTFLLKTNFAAPSLTFNVVDEDDNDIIYSGKTEYLGQLWGMHYSLGNFSAISEAGNYSIRISIGGKEYASYKFEISEKVFLKFIDLLYKFFYYQRCGTKVFDDVVPGYKGHEACHLDDATNKENSSEYINLTGGWHDAGDYNKYHGTTAISLLGLAMSYEMGMAYFNNPDLCDDYPVYKDYSYQSDSISDLLEEVIWGADFVAKLVREDGSVIDRVGSNDEQGWYGYTGPPSLETDGDPNTTADNRIYGDNNGGSGLKIAASLLKTAEILNSTALSGEIRDKFNSRMKFYLNKGKAARSYYYRDPHKSTSWWAMEDLMIADLSLYKLTGNITYKNEADFIGAGFIYNESYYNFKNPGFGHIGIDQVPAKLFYWAMENGSAEIKSALVNKYKLHYDDFWGPLTSMDKANNYFNLLRGRTPDLNEFYFWDYTNAGWNVGQNSYYAVAAWASILAYNLTGEYKFLNLALRQIDWICGRNPFGLTMIEGVGYKNLPGYHNRASTINGNYRGAVPGCVPNGMIRAPEIISESGSYADIPYYDPTVPTPESCHINYMSNEPWIPHNSNLLLAITALYRFAINSAIFYN